MQVGANSSGRIMRQILQVSGKRMHVHSSNHAGRDTQHKRGVLTRHDHNSLMLHQHFTAHPQMTTALGFEALPTTSW